MLVKSSSTAAGRGHLYVRHDDRGVSSRCLTSYHQSFVHEELLPRGAVVVLGVNGEAEEEDVHHNLKDGQEAMSHQEGEETDDDERQQPLGVIPLVVEKDDAGERGRCHNQDLRKDTEGTDPDRL